VPEILIQSLPRRCIVRVGRGFSQPDLSMDRVASDRFVIADRRVEKIARPWIADGAALFLAGGERAKTLANALKIVKLLLQKEHERGTPVVAIGGGSICDLAGFAAAVYKRGVPLHLVPTTLLAQVDAAIGGKNGVDLPEGKNLVGTIRQPDTVLVDPLLLGPLPGAEFASGLAEVVKCGVIRDAALFELLEKRGAEILAREPGVLSEMLVRAITVKVDAVRADEQDGGERALLNYGHTIGHAIEAAKSWRLRHGEAVALGMEAAAWLAWKMGLFSKEAAARQTALLTACGLPTRLPGLRIPAVIAALRHDKKREGGKARFVLPEDVGRARHGVEVDEKLVLEAVKRISSA
jgi:3-dehydroquinate synthase